MELYFYLGFWLTRAWGFRVLTELFHFVLLPLLVGFEFLYSAGSFAFTAKNFSFVATA